MSNEQLNFSRWLQELTARSFADQQRASERYTELMQRVARGELNDQQVREEFLRFASEAGTAYARDLAQLGLNYYTALLDLGRVYNDRFFDQMLYRGGPTTRPDNGGETEAQPRQVTLDLRGMVGQEAAAGFVIENKRAVPAEISFLVSDCVDTAGGTPFRPPLQLQPLRFTLGPQEEAQVNLRLPLSPGMFVAGRQYRTKVVVHGYDDLELLINVKVEPAAEPATRVSAVVTPPTVPPPVETPEPKRPSSAKKTTGKRTQRRTKNTG